MLNTLKKNLVIAELKKRGIHKIDGQAVELADYRVLVSTLAIKRAAEH